MSGAYCLANQTQKITKTLYVTVQLRKGCSSNF